MTNSEIGMMIVMIACVVFSFVTINSSGKAIEKVKNERDELLFKLTDKLQENGKMRLESLNKDIEISKLKREIKQYKSDNLKGMLVK